jgi:hypothetical protein
MTRPATPANDPKFVWIRRFALVEARTLPGPFSIDLNLERPTQEGSDEYDEAEHANGGEGGIDGDTADDVGSNQQFQSDQDCSAQVRAQTAVRRPGIPRTDEDGNVSRPIWPADDFYNGSLDEFQIWSGFVLNNSPSLTNIARLVPSRFNPDGILLPPA